MLTRIAFWAVEYASISKIHINAVTHSCEETNAFVVDKATHPTSADFNILVTGSTNTGLSASLVLPVSAAAIAAQFANGPQS